MRMEKSIKYEDKLVKVEELLNEVIRVAYFIFTFLFLNFLGTGTDSLLAFLQRWQRDEVYEISV